MDKVRTWPLHARAGFGLFLIFIVAALALLFPNWGGKPRTVSEFLAMPSTPCYVIYGITFHTVQGVPCPPAAEVEAVVANAASRVDYLDALFKGLLQYATVVFVDDPVYCAGMSVAGCTSGDTMIVMWDTWKTTLRHEQGHAMIWRDGKPWSGHQPCYFWRKLEGRPCELD